MAKTRLFVSFDYSHDLRNKDNFIFQANDKNSPFSVVDVSLREEAPQAEWVNKAQSAISKCDVFMILLGPNTHNAPGVGRELGYAKGIRKPCFQLMPQGQSYHPLDNGGDVCVWRWGLIEKTFARLRNQGILRS